mmetsp:Transcript_4305/g.13527  ORF Transcript_4305/g.13527 Transcript_4305/m.13527 type:complete len:112 (-) Transcript_4305:1118-1453(-)
MSSRGANLYAHAVAVTLAIHAEKSVAERVVCCASLGDSDVADMELCRAAASLISKLTTKHAPSSFYTCRQHNFILLQYNCCPSPRTFTFVNSLHGPNKSKRCRPRSLEFTA